MRCCAVPEPPPARVALVPGATGGIGRAVAAGLAGDGVSVGLLGRDRGRLDEVRRTVDAEVAGARTAVAPADVTDLAAVRVAVAEVETALGPVDLLVDIAGRIESAEVPVWEADPDEWWGVVETDLRGPFHVVQAVVPGMLARGGGRVVHLSTGMAVRDGEIYSGYSAAKTGLVRLGGALHAAGYARGLRAFELMPGVVDTPMTRSMPVHADRTEWTAPAEVVGLLLAIARGGLDAWSGRVLRAGVDTVGRLAEVAASGLPAEARTLRLRPYGPDDPLGG